MQALLDERDYQTITNEVLKRLKKQYDLVPKSHNQIEDWVGIQEFTNCLPVKKDKEWVRMFILSLPVFKNWVINLNAGSGYPTRVNKTEAMAWIKDHRAEIDWNKPLPR
ncbi:hypothetical protein H5S40_03040 [Limosilactobacillus sp. RRLNB_1_1]|uniref:DUF771 domain-containing protein n=1 Tax=Limosilactobacillus albertensis TaxID=2759752 RepID=A0A7W3Y7W4_9LACO|nr:hypothetical protein [Limosilactobacillus albertensis]MBB1069134.1 hypothetical protein [Limosilactobacillus albertensis]MCD7117447.1 hypothetical protein [Limosilactobacillus albertensis]MCD7127919.1 hypothetical protein [Limosilactobacillus albertensis]